MSGGRRFDPERWLDNWLMVGAVMVQVGGVLIVANLDGNAAAQRSLLSKLDGEPRRRAQVRDAMLARVQK